MVEASTNPEGNPDTNGALVVYDSQRGYDSDIFWRPVIGGSEIQLPLAGNQRNPSIAGDFIAFESQASVFAASDVFVYDTVNNRLFQITHTPLVNGELNDLTLLPDGRLRLVWTSDEDGFDQRNIKAKTFALPNIAPTLSYSAETGYATDGVSPDSGLVTTAFTYKVVYADFENQAPSSINVCIDAACHAMSVDTAADASLQDGNQKNGEQYSYSTTLAAGTRAYFFEASDGTDTARLPAASTLTGPLVNGAASEITNLIDLVTSFNLKQGIENSLDAKLQNVLAALNAAGAGDTATACSLLSAFLHEVQAQSGKAITALQAGQLVTAANQVRLTLGCP